MRIILLPLALMIFTTNAGGSVTVYTNKTQWINAIGSHTRIGFDEYPPDINITTQYAPLGVIFTDGDDRTDFNPAYSTDQHGLFSDPAHVRMVFTQSMLGLAFEYTDIMQVSLFSHGTEIYESELFTAGFYPFFGFESTTPFDEAVITDPTGVAITIDNVYFGHPVPAPGALGLLTVGALVPRRRWKEPT